MLVAAGVAGIVVMTSSQSALACKFMVDVIDSSSSSRSSSSIYSRQVAAGVAGVVEITSTHLAFAYKFMLHVIDNRHQNNNENNKQYDAEENAYDGQPQ